MVNSGQFIIDIFISILTFVIDIILYIVDIRDFTKCMIDAFFSFLPYWLVLVYIQFFPLSELFVSYHINVMIFTYFIIFFPIKIPSHGFLNYIDYLKNNSTIRYIVCIFYYIFLSLLFTFFVKYYITKAYC